MAEEEFTVGGLTGVDIVVRVAGPGARSYAFLIDWQIRLLSALTLVLAAYLLRIQPHGVRPWAHTVWAGTLVVASLIYFLYHPVLEVLMHGRTPGKRKAGVRLITVEGAIPSTGSLLMRNLFRLIDCMPGPYMVGLGCCVLTDKRVRLGDMVAGTVLVLEQVEASQRLARLGSAVQSSALPFEVLRLIQDLLDRWRDLEAAQRMRLGQALLRKFDPQFDERDAKLTEARVRARLETLLGTGPKR